MRIERIELWHVRFPLPRPFYPSWIPGYPQRENRFDLIRIFTRDGIPGISAVPALSREREGLGSVLGPYLLNLDPLDLSTVNQRLRELSYLGLRHYWVEPAFWDLRGKLQGKPVYELLGGKPGHIRLYASLGEIKRPRELIALVERVASSGFKVIKLRVHRESVAEDHEEVEAVVHAFSGSDLRFGVDANQGWRVDIADPAPLWNYTRALRFARLCEELGILWLEEPLAMEEYDALRWLRSQSRIPLAGGELQRGGTAELLKMIESGCYSIYQPDATLVEGITGSLKIMSTALAYGERFTPHTWTNGIGFAINLQIFAAHPQRDQELLEYPYNPPSWLPEYRDALLEVPFLSRGDELELPKSPGLGITLNERALRRYGRCFYKATPLRVAFQVVRDRGFRTTWELYQKQQERQSRHHGRSQ